MNYRKLAHTELEVSAVCMGCWQISTERSDYWGSQDARDSMDAIYAAMEAGINFFDTAEDYDEGGSEILLGKALGRHRRDVLIATKASPRHAAPEQLHKACEDSLRRLNTDVIDLYQLEQPRADVPLDDTLAAMLKLRKQGKIRAIGLSNFGVSYLREVSEAGAVASNQLPYSLLWRAIERDILPACRQMGLSVLCYSPLMQGLLTGKYQTVEDVPSGRTQTRIFSSRRGAAHEEAGCEEQVFAAIREIGRICDSIGQPMADVAIAWVLAQPTVTCVIAGARSVEQAKQNALASELTLPEEVIRRLAEAAEPVRQAIGSNADMWMHESRMERAPTHAA